MVLATLLLTTPVIVSTENSPLKFETNAIQDNRATLSLCSKELADAIALQGEERPLGLAVLGNQNLVQQAFKATIAVSDAQGVYVGNAVVQVVSEFVNLNAVDWSQQVKDFPHLRALNFPTPFCQGQSHLLFGNDNHHLTQAKQKSITTDVNPQAYPYAELTPLGWCAAGTTLLPIPGDTLFNMQVRAAVAAKQIQDKAELLNIRDKVIYQE